MLTPALLLFFWTERILSQEHLAVDYSTKVIRSVADDHGGHFSWWIYNLEAADTGFVTELLNDPRLRNIPRQSMTTTSITVVDPFEHTPSLIVIRCVACGPSNDWEHLMYANVSVETKILVVHQCESRQEFLAMVRVFERLKLPNTVFLDLDVNLISYKLFYKQELILIRNFEVAPSALFVDQARDLNGRRVAISMSDPKLETTIFPQYRAMGRDIAWMKFSILHLNGSVGLSIIDCSYYSYAECAFKRKFQFKNKTTYDISVDPSYGTRMKYFFIYAVEPDRSVIMVPGGQRLTPLEVFIVPFHFHVWILLTLLVTACWTLVLYYSDTFVNDPILAALSGIERISFHRTSKPEKLLILILSIIFFILLQAYETKIIAMMTSYPYMSDPRDLDDLARLGIKVRHIEGGSNFTFSNNAQLESLIQTVTTSNVSHIFKYAVFGDENMLKLIISMPRYFYNRDERFILLKDYHLGLSIRQYFMAQRSLLASKFKQTQQIFFEVGLRKFWTDQVMHIYRLRAQHKVREAGLLTQLDVLEQDDDILGIDKMAPAWYVILVGWFCSAVVCVGEIVYRRCGSRKIAQR